MFEPVTKFNAQVDRIEELSVLMRQAFRSAMSGAPAPAQLDLAGIAGEQIISAEADLDVIAEPRFSRLPPFRPRPDPADVAAVATMLAPAERPAIVAAAAARRAARPPSSRRWSTSCASPSPTRSTRRARSRTATR